MAFIPKKKFSAGSKRSQNITDGLVEFISKDMMPISIVEGKGLINFLKILEPQYTLPSRKTITKRLTDKYDQIRASVQMKLDSMPAAALTLDYWTSRATDSYLGITVHCISVDWQMVSYVLETKEVIERHTSENVAEDIKVVVHRWGLTHRIDCITTDNARNIVAAMRLVQWKRHPCFAHTPQLGVKAGLTIPAVANILASCRKIVGHFKHSYLAQNALEKKQESLNIAKHKLVQDIVTRWNSSYQMLDTLLEQERAVSAVLAESTKASDRDLIQSSDVVCKMIYIRDVLKPLAIATERLCVEKYPSLSLVQPVLTALLKKHLVTADTDPDITVQLKTAIADNLKAHFLDKKQREFALLASAVDPRYKSLKFLDSSERGAVFRILVEVIGNEQVEDTVSTAKQLKTVEEDILDYAASSGSSGSNSPNDSRLSNIIEKEVSLYCSDDEIDHGDDPLEWWRLNSHRFPNISQFARCMLCIQATSVPSERLFSAAGNLVTSKRASLHPDNVDKLLFLNKNM